VKIGAVVPKEKSFGAAAAAAAAAAPARINNWTKKKLELERGGG
jgi:hypothetical protein